ncbi:antibiotic biosynthesis monooxygenase [Roseofilum sp. BLCC_M143]|uniref:Antibiotic biosynthesis monooxygenase n=1 Tax=Roseofilum casamattae BLCC-M143 TaxID=3022442 RepID=A0ABT7BZK4_9CYAN|nr:antibiotic biosynthesis monooxygenase [Roseofilum casamattae]MDJ1184637.1 antibiotic biosynthesis monooxygenase [Roseofilum casamattae BLCC-M143]
MILEVAKLDIIPGEEQNFEADFQKAEAILVSTQGYVSHELKRCIEMRSRYLLLVYWETLEDHTQGFRGSASYQEWKQLLHPYYDPFPEVEHYESLSDSAMNAICIIHPYKLDEMWVFDDERVGLIQEPFVAGADTIIETMVQQLPNAESGFTLLFSSHAFPGYQLQLNRQRKEYGGHWYYSPQLDREGWLCPALFRSRSRNIIRPVSSQTGS